MPILKLNAILPFNEKTDLPPCYLAPADKFDPKGKKILLDVSGSMEREKDELKLTVSMLKALAGLDSLPPVPQPTGQTNLIGKIRKVVQSPDFGEQELIIITDGLDNQNEINDFQVGLTENGEPRMININEENYGSHDDYMRARQEAILDYLTFIGAQVHIIGIGNEVKQLLKMAASRPMTVAHVPRRATASHVASVVGAAINIVRDTAIATGDFSTSEERGTASDARIITVENLCGQSPAEQEQVNLIVSDAGRVYIGDDAFTVESFKEAFSTAENAVAITEEAKKYTRGVVMWLMKLSLTKGKIPGAIIGGKFAKVFAAPESAGDWKVNKLLSELKKVNILVAKKEQKLEFVLESRSRTFTTVECYEAAPCAAHLVLQMADDSEWATPEEDLVKSNKRCREEQE